MTIVQKDNPIIYFILPNKVNILVNDGLNRKTSHLTLQNILSYTLINEKMGLTMVDNGTIGKKCQMTGLEILFYTYGISMVGLTWSKDEKENEITYIYSVDNGNYGLERPMLIKINTIIVLLYYFIDTIIKESRHYG